MTTETKKRQRGNNFSITDKTIFVNILEKYVSVIECKKTDGNNIQIKEQAWENLLQEFNSHPNVTKRNVKQLKLFYDNYKRKSKKKYADEKVGRPNLKY
ncbi:hypothetical protein C0J52_08814 [Blattella germanica]|nr:hypothetical protein C0J52_08814 [Blattella germanica]